MIMRSQADGCGAATGVYTLWDQVSATVESRLCSAPGTIGSRKILCYPAWQESASPGLRAPGTLGVCMGFKISPMNLDVSEYLGESSCNWGACCKGSDPELPLLLLILI